MPEPQWKNSAGKLYANADGYLFTSVKEAFHRSPVPLDTRLDNGRSDGNREVISGRGIQGARWSVGRKTDAVMRLLRGEDLDELSRELRWKPTAWRHGGTSS